MIKFSSLTTCRPVTSKAEILCLQVHFFRKSVIFALIPTLRVKVGQKEQIEGLCFGLLDLRSDLGVTFFLEGKLDGESKL